MFSHLARNLLARVRRSSSKRGSGKPRLAIEALETRLTPSFSVWTDKPDYAPSETATIVGTGLQPGETVQLQVLHIDGTPNTGEGHGPWVVQDGFWTLDGQNEFTPFIEYLADGTEVLHKPDLDHAEDGSFQTDWFVHPDDSLGATFELTANASLSGVATTIFTDAGPAADLDILANLDTSNGEWSNGADKLSYREGDSVPFRILFSGLTTGTTYSVVINYDTTKDGKHTFDYLTTWNQSINGDDLLDPNDNPDPTDAPDPLEGVTGVSTTAVTAGGAIPVDTAVSNGQDGASGGGDDITQIPGTFTLYGATFDSVSGYSSAGLFSGDSSNSITVTFTAGDDKAVLLFAAHIATRADWGQDNSAISISGSPYHVSLSEGTNLGNIGSQDQKVKSEAIVYPSSITIIKDVAGGEDATDFDFTATGGLSPSTFTLDDDSTSSTSNTQTYSGITTFTTYTFAELAAAGWDLTNIVITGSSSFKIGSDSDFDSGDTEASITLAEGEDVVITFTNAPTPQPSLAIEKEASVPGDTADEVGDIISYTITVQNTGNQTLTNVNVDDPSVSDLTRVDDLVGDNDDLLEVGETWKYTATYTVQQSDIDDGDDIVNTASVTTDQTQEQTDSATVTVDQNPGLSIDKEASVPGDTVDEAGDIISYTITVQNTGNQTLTNVNVDDPSVSDLTRVDDLVGDNDDLLEVGETWKYTATYTVQQSDIDDGEDIINTASVTTDQTEEQTDSATTTVDQNPGLSIDKEASVPGDTADEVGDIISYTITVQNTGNQTLTNVNVADPSVNDLTRVDDLVGNDDDLLEVGETWKYTATYTVQQSDIDDGDDIVNTASVTTDQTEEQTDSATTTVDQNPGLSIDKEASVPGDTADTVGEIISYTITVQNTGNQTLTNVAVEDPSVSDLTRVDDLVGDNDDLLEVGETWKFTASHTVTQEELEADEDIVNTATADSDQTEEESDSATTSVEPAVVVVAADITFFGAKFLDSNGLLIPWDPTPIAQGGLGAVTFQLYLDNGTTPFVVDPGDTLLQSALTGAGGLYALSAEVTAGNTYIIHEVVPAGYTQVTPDRVITFTADNLDDPTLTTDLDFTNRINDRSKRAFVRRAEELIRSAQKSGFSYDIVSDLIGKYGWATAGKKSFWGLITTAVKTSGLNLEGVLKVIDDFGWNIAGKTSFWQLIATARKQSGLNTAAVVDALHDFGWNVAGKTSFWTLVGNAKKWSGLNAESVLDILAVTPMSTAKLRSFWQNLP